jgi:hypothetical protein
MRITESKLRNVIRRIIREQTDSPSSGGLPVKDPKSISSGPTYGHTDMKNGLNIDEHGTKRWYLNGKLHRQDGPAAEWAHGSKAWYLNGKLHRQDGPAEERADGSKVWYLDGKLHRQDGPAEEWANGTKRWYLDGKLHRQDGPAVEHADGTKFWYLRGKRHRTDGPAAERTDGTKRWYLDGKYLGEGGEGFWALWEKLTHTQRSNLNLHFWLVKYT